MKLHRIESCILADLAQRNLNGSTNDIGVQPIHARLSAWLTKTAKSALGSKLCEGLKAKIDREAETRTIVTGVRVIEKRNDPQHASGHIPTICFGQVGDRFHRSTQQLRSERRFVRPFQKS